MDKSLENSLASAVDAAKTLGISTADFLTAQAPELCEQIVRYEIVLNGFFVGLGVLFSLLLVLGARMLYDEGGKDVPTLKWLMGLVFAIVGILFGPALIISHAGGLIKATTAPKLVIVERVAALAGRSVR